MKAVVAAIAMMMALTPGLAAQGIDPQCPPGSANALGQPDNTRVAQDACQKAIDLFRYIAPQLGTVLAGGNPTQGITGTLGGLGHFSFGLRGNALRASLPEVDRVVPATRGAVASTYPIDTSPAGLVTADAALGIFRGLQRGRNRVGGVDLLVTASYIPEYSSEAVDVSVPSGSLELGIGAKIGLLQESAVAPGVAVSFLGRRLPSVVVIGRSGDDRLTLEDIQVSTRSWRAVAGKKILFFGVAAGFGRDTYNSKASISVTVAPRPLTQGGSGGPIALSQKLTRTNVFGSAWISAKVLRIVGEIGRVSGGSITTYNQFDGPQPADARTYASVGLSFGR